MGLSNVCCLHVLDAVVSSTHAGQTATISDETKTIHYDMLFQCRNTRTVMELSKTSSRPDLGWK